MAVAQSAVIDPKLKPGQTSTTVDVRDVTPVVTLDSATVAAGMERRRIEQLPINGRSLATLLAVLPGHEPWASTRPPERNEAFPRASRLPADAGKVLDKFIGGWQIAGIGNLRTQLLYAAVQHVSRRASPSRITAISTRSRTAAAPPAFRATCGGTVTSLPPDQQRGRRGKTQRSLWAIPSDYKPAVHAARFRARGARQLAGKCPRKY